jgi:hypothetical protein
VVGPLHNPLDASDHARALLLVRLREACRCTPCEPVPAAAVEEHALSRRTPDVLECDTGPVPFWKFLARQNEEFRAAKERAEWRPWGEAGREGVARPFRAGAERQGAAEGRVDAAAQAQAKRVYQRPAVAPVPTGRLVDMFI